MVEKEYMQAIMIIRVPAHLNQTVTLNGWVYNSRRSGKIGFLLLRDGTGIIQCIIVKNDVGEGQFENFKNLTQESSVSVTGLIVENHRAPGGFELQTASLRVHQICEDYPITPKEHGTEFLMNRRHLWLRSKRQHAILKVRHEIIKATRDFFDSNDFTLVDTPILTPNVCEGTTTLFETEYFGQRVFLAQSGQLYGEANAFAFGRQYNFGPTFRAEKSKTRRHLLEFWMVEPEMAYCDLEEDMRWAEKMLEFIVTRVLQNRQDELEILERDTSMLEKVKAPFPRVSYSKCVDMLKAGGFDFEWGGDFGSPEETYISGQFDRPLIVHRFPSAIKAFYMKRDPMDENLAMGMDILAPEGYGEIIGGSEREADHDILLRRIHEDGLSLEDFQWYLDLRKFGSVPHSGFGMGIERTVTWICKLSHLREAIPFPRMYGRLKP